MAKIKILSEGLYFLKFKILEFYINFIQYKTTVHVVFCYLQKLVKTQ